MKPKYLILIFIILLNSQGFSQEQKENQYIHALINTICQNPDTLLTILNDSNYTSSVIIKLYNKNKNKEYSKDNYLNEMKDLVKYFQNKHKIILDTIIKPYSYKFIIFDSLRVIKIMGDENKELTFLFIFESFKWKIVFFFDIQLPELKLDYKYFSKNREIIDSIMKNPDIAKGYAYIDKSSKNNQNFIYKIIKILTAFINHNYKDGYTIEKEYIYEEKENSRHNSLNTYCQDLIIQNANHKRPFQITFKCNVGDTIFKISDAVFYKKSLNSEDMDKWYQEDSLTEEEIRLNRILIKKILTHPESLKEIIKDSTLADEQLIKFLSNDSVLFKIINYIKENFSENYIIKFENIKPYIDKYRRGRVLFNNFHMLILYNEKKNRNLYINFNDSDELYHFKLTGLKTRKSEIDGIDYEQGEAIE